MRLSLAATEEEIESLIRELRLDIPFVGQQVIQDVVRVVQLQHASPADPAPTPKKRGILSRLLSLFE